jgi:hypothetical protein
MLNKSFAERVVTSIDPNQPTSSESSGATRQSDVAPRASTEPSAAPAVDMALADSLHAFEYLRQDIKVFPKDHAAVINSDVGVMTQRAFWASRQLQGIVDVIKRDASTFDVSKIDRLRMLALALNYLHGRLLLLKEANKTEEATKLVKLRERLKKAVDFLVSEEIISEARVEQFKASPGHHGLAYNLGGLVDILLETGQDLSKPFMSRAELQAVRRQADSFFDVLGEKEFGPGTHAELKLARRKVYAMLTALWNEVYAMVSYVRYHDGDADSLMPPLYPNKPSRRVVPAGADPGASNSDGGASSPVTPAEDDEPDFDEDEPAEAPLNVEAINAAAARAANATTVGGVVPAGFPGSRPLRPLDAK